MFDYQTHFDSFCRENGLDLRLSFDMPPGYETANGTFDAETKTVYLNAALLHDAPDHEQAFYFFHELRHAAQELCPAQCSEAVRRSLRYVIRYDGVCYKRIGGEYAECRLEGGADRFADLYLGQPHETDANAFAYAQARALYGDSDGLRELYAFWTPRRPVSDAEYDAVFAEIEENVRLQGRKGNV